MPDNQFLEAVWRQQAEEGLSDVELARRLQMSQSTISRLKGSSRAPGLDFINAVLREWPALVGYLLPKEAGTVATPGGS